MVQARLISFFNPIQKSTFRPCRSRPSPTSGLLLRADAVVHPKARRPACAPNARLGPGHLDSHRSVFFFFFFFFCSHSWGSPVSLPLFYLIDPPLSLSSPVCDCPGLRLGLAVYQCVGLPPAVRSRHLGVSRADRAIARPQFDLSTRRPPAGPHRP